MVQGSHSLPHRVQGTPHMLRVSSPPLLFLALKEQQYFEISECVPTHCRLPFSFCGCYHSPEVFLGTDSCMCVFLPCSVFPMASFFYPLPAFSDTSCFCCSPAMWAVLCLFLLLFALALHSSYLLVTQNPNNLGQKARWIWCGLFHIKRVKLKTTLFFSTEMLHPY